MMVPQRKFWHLAQTFLPACVGKIEELVFDILTIQNSSYSELTKDSVLRVATQCCKM